MNEFSVGQMLPTVEPERPILTKDSMIKEENKTEEEESVLDKMIRELFAET